MIVQRKGEKGREREPVQYESAGGGNRNQQGNQCPYPCRRRDGAANRRNSSSRIHSFHSPGLRYRNFTNPTRSPSPSTSPSLITSQLITFPLSLEHHILSLSLSLCHSLSRSPTFIGTIFSPFSKCFSFLFSFSFSYNNNNNDFLKAIVRMFFPLVINEFSNFRYTNFNYFA